MLDTETSVEELVDASTGDGSAEPSGSCDVRLLSAELAEIPTVVVVELGGDASLEGAVVEFGTDDQFPFAAPVDITTNPPRAVLVGLPAETAFSYRVRLAPGDQDCPADVHNMTTGAFASGVPTDAAVSLGEGSNATTSGFVLTESYLGSWVYMVNVSGRIVWAYSVPSTALSRALLSPDKQHVYARDLNMSAEGDVTEEGGVLYKIAIDGSSLEIFTLAASHHDFALTPNGDVYYLSKVGSPAEDLPCDAIHRLSPDGESDEVVFDFWPALSPFVPDDTLGDLESCHVNSLRYDADSATLTAGDSSRDVVVKVTTGGEVVWTLGPSGTTFVSDAPFDHQYGHQVLGDDGILVFDNGPFPESRSSRVYELALDPVAGVANVVWNYDSGLYSAVLGDVQRLSNGNTFVTYSTDRIVHEVDGEGELVRALTFPELIGYSQYVESLY